MSIRLTTPPSGIGTSATESAGAAEAEALVTADDDDADDAGVSFEPDGFEQPIKHGEKQKGNMTPASHIRAFIACI
jgi:hypothetical protein